MSEVIIITGGNSGIGFECVKQFCETFSDKLIIVVSKNINNLLELSYKNFQYIACDITDYQKLKTLIENIANTHNIGCLINCAGTAYYNDFCNIDTTKIQQMIDVNIKGLTNAIELVLPYMRKQQLGTIINISSLADRYPRPLAAVYGASKAYVKSISDSLRVSEAKYNIRVCNISPALIDTPLSRKVRQGTWDKIEVEDFVNVIKFVYNQPQSVCIRDLVIAPTNYQN
ncbi:MAG: SDR family oxidoreductase [Neisseriaceae bacterium]